MFFTITWRKMPMDKSILKNIAGYYQNRHTCGDNFTYKNFKKLSLVESLFNITHYYSLQPRNLLNSDADDFLRVFWNSCPEIFGKLSEKHNYWSFLLIQLQEVAGIHSTAHHLIKDCITDTLQKCPERK